MRSTARALVFAAAVVALASSMFFVGRWGLGWAKDLDEYRFDPQRVDLGELCPAWLEVPMARAFFATYLGVAGEPFSLLDEVALQSFVSRVEGLLWVRSLVLRPELPNRLELDLRLARPVAVAPPLAGQLWLISTLGVLLPLDRAAAAEDPLLKKIVESLRAFDLPRPGDPVAELELPYGLPLILGGGTNLVAEARSSAAARRCLADGAAIAQRALESCWPRARSQLVERKRDDWMPRLLGVDVSNSGMRLIRRSEDPEFRLVVVSRDGRAVYLAWGHAPDGRFEEIPWEQKARVLSFILGHSPGLVGLASADLRFVGRWKERMVRLGL